MLRLDQRERNSKHVGPVDVSGFERSVFTLREPQGDRAGNILTWILEGYRSELFKLDLCGELDFGAGVVSAAFNLVVI